MKDSVLFVCRGNICRSPTAEGVLRRHAQLASVDARMEIASAGTGDWHVGEPPDRRAIAHAQKRGYDIGKQRARQIAIDDYHRFHWILAMDRGVLREVNSLRPLGADGHIGLFLDLAPELGVREVPDPYFGGTNGFEKALDLIEAACKSLLQKIIAERLSA